MLSVVRARHVPLVFVFAATTGCGDGVGRPIVEDEPIASGAGASSAGAPSNGASAGMGGAGAGGRGENPGLGGRFSGWDGMAGRDDSRPPPPCEGIEEWPQDSNEAEWRAFEFLTIGRELGFACMADGVAEYLPPLVMRPELQCAARRHSRDMNERGFFGHVNPDGEDVADRIRRTGYGFGVAGEAIARASGAPETDPFEVLESLRVAGGPECENLVDPRFDAVGIGRYGDLWTLDFSGP
jgi:hypothetical protein